MAAALVLPKEALLLIIQAALVIVARVQVLLLFLCIQRMLSKVTDVNDFCILMHYNLSCSLLRSRIVLNSSIWLIQHLIHHFDNHRSQQNDPNNYYKEQSYLRLLCREHILRLIEGE